MPLVLADGSLFGHCGRPADDAHAGPTFLMRRKHCASLINGLHHWFGDHILFGASARLIPQNRVRLLLLTVFDHRFHHGDRFGSRDRSAFQHFDRARFGDKLRDHDRSFDESWTAWRCGRLATRHAVAKLFVHEANESRGMPIRRCE